MRAFPVRSILHKKTIQMEAGPDPPNALRTKFFGSIDLEAWPGVPKMRKIAYELHMQPFERFRTLKEQVLHDVLCKMHIFDFP